MPPLPNLLQVISTISGEVRMYINKWVELSFCLPQKLHKKQFLVEDEGRPPAAGTCPRRSWPGQLPSSSIIYFVHSINDILKRINSSPR
jgi:hypothetical protein